MLLDGDADMQVRVLLLDLGSPQRARSEPIGIDTLAAVLQDRFKAVVDVRLWFAELDTVSAESVMDSFRPDILGISANIGRSTELSQIIEHNGTSSPSTAFVVVGGTLATYVWDGLLRAHPETVCVIGEGEEALVRIVGLVISKKCSDTNELKQECIRSGVPNLGVLLEDRIQTTRRVRSDLRTLPAPTRQFVGSVLAQGGLVSIEGSRGCPWGKCTFCGIGQKYGPGGWLPFPLERVTAELKKLSALGAHKIYFTDEDFVGSNPSRAIEFCRRVVSMKRSGIIAPGVSFFANTSVRALGLPSVPHRLNSELTDAMLQAGIREIFVGLESGSPSQLRRYGKNHTVAEARECLMALRAAGFQIDVGFIMFDPEVTLHELRENLEFCRITGIHETSSRLSKTMRLTPCTRLTERLERECGISQTPSLDEAAYEYSFHSAVVEAVYDAYQEWEAECLPFAYCIQAAVRQRPAEAANQLSLLRGLDFAVLDECVRSVECEPNSLGRLNTITQKYLSQLRECVSDKVP